MNASISEFPLIKFERFNVKPGKQGFWEHCVSCPCVDEYIVYRGKIAARWMAHANVYIHRSHDDAHNVQKAL